MSERSDRTDPIPPGEILLEEFMKPFGISQHRLSREIAVPVSRVCEIVRGKRAITADTALRLAKYFRTSPDVWLGLQQQFELSKARRDIWPTVEGRIRPIEAWAGRTGL